MNFSTSNSKVAIYIKQFFITIALGLLLLFGASEMLIRSYILPQDELTKHTNLFHNSQSVDAAFGDSHVARGFVPPKQMINLAYPSESIPQTDWKIRKYFSTKAPGRIVLQADPHMFATYRLNRGVGKYPEIFTKEPAPSYLELYILNKKFRANLVNYWVSYIKNGAKLVSKIQFTKNGAHLSPGNEAEVNQRLRKHNAINRVKTQKIPTNGAVDKYKKIYSSLLDYLNQRNAKICMVSFPLSPDYHQALNNTNATAFNDIVQYFITEAKRNDAVYVNFMHSVKELEKFRDADHLNGQSAQAFSHDIIKACFE